MHSLRERRLARAVETSRDTRQVLIAPGALTEAAAIFETHFPGNSAVIVADARTFNVAARSVHDVLMRRGIATREPFVFDDPHLYAEHRFVERLERSLAGHDAIPIAVGAGTINDLTKLAAHRTHRQYMSVGTAASMDGYTAYGASITFEGSKQTFDCPAPRAVVADLDIVAAAPQEMTASGYADLLAKITAGADWIVADALGIEPIDSRAWELVQTPLRAWLESPQLARDGHPDAIANLLEGLMMSGLAMQSTMSSRPASGAEHQFSHLWDMQHHTHRGEAPSHGFKVGVATAAVGRLYERLLDRDLSRALDIEHCLARWPGLDEMKADIARLFDDPSIREKALLESSAKYVTRDALEVELRRVKSRWTSLRQKLKTHLFTSDEFREGLIDAGAPAEPEKIGIEPQRLARSHRLAYHIRRRYTVLDLAVRCDMLETLIA